MQPKGWGVSQQPEHQRGGVCPSNRNTVQLEGRGVSQQSEHYAAFKGAGCVPTTGTPCSLTRRGGVCPGNRNTTPII